MTRELNLDLKGATIVEGEVHNGTILLGSIVVQTPDGKKYEIEIDSEYGEAYLDVSEIKENNS